MKCIQGAMYIASSSLMIPIYPIWSQGPSVVVGCSDRVWMLLSIDWGNFKSKKHVVCVDDCLCPNRIGQ